MFLRESMGTGSLAGCWFGYILNRILDLQVFYLLSQADTAVYVAF